MIFDYDLEFLEDAATLIDSRIDCLRERSESSEDPDALGIWDQTEYITGFGFVACQTYMTAKMGRGRTSDERQKLQSLGPQHSNGCSFAQLVNVAANFWKHSSEWERDRLDKKPASKTRDVLSSLNLDIDASYPLTNVLYAVLAPDPARFIKLIPILVQWRDVLPHRSGVVTGTDPRS